MLIHFVVQQAKRLTLVCSTPQEAQQEVWWMLEVLTGMSVSQLQARIDNPLSAAQHEQLEQWIIQRVEQHKPLQYVIGSVPFCGIQIKVKPPTLIPRPETEEWVSWLIQQLNPVQDQPLAILDLCTGTGCIALALAHALPHAFVVAVDDQPAAVKLVQENGTFYGNSNVKVVQSNLYDALSPTQTFDLIVSNPPYLAADERDTLSPAVKEWEDEHALVAGPRGIEIYEKIMEQAYERVYKSCLGHRGLPVIVLELGVRCHHEIERLMHEKGFARVDFFNDMQGKRRWMAGYVG